MCSGGSLYISTLWLDLHPLMAEGLPINLLPPLIGSMSPEEGIEASRVGH